LHLLAYLFDPADPDLAAETARIRDDRVLRAQAMVDRLIDLGIPITWDDVAAIAGSAVVGRPHIARAMAASGAIASPDQAFTREWIADGGRAYVDRYALEAARAIGLVRAAGQRARGAYVAVRGRDRQVRPATRRAAARRDRLSAGLLHLPGRPAVVAAPAQREPGGLDRLRRVPLWGERSAG